jgi:S-DNA-T family DNA segregation ATPase FtsK/SpoIIIE
MRVLTMSEIRRHLYWTGGGPGSGGDGAACTALLGQLFHELYGALTGTNAQTNLAAPLELADASPAAWRQSLIDHVFAAVVAPALSRHEGMLQTHGAAVLDFWTAVQELCGWLAAVMHDQRAADATRSLEAVRRQLFADTEIDLEVELTDPAWPEPVRLRGRAGAMLVRCADAGRCLIELKLGRTHPEADLLQVCLHQLMLTQREPSIGEAALALISFEPRRCEHVFAGERLREARAALRALIAELAGFTGRLAPPGIAAQAAAPAPLAPQPAAQPAAALIPTVADRDLVEIRRKLTDAFTEYGAALNLAPESLCGPAFIRFFATPQRGISVTRLARLAANVGMRIGTSQAPQVCLQQGRVSIDVERPDRQAVNFFAWRSRLGAKAPAGSAQFAIGVDVEGGLRSADLSKSQSPHLLVVGNPGSGKSEWLRAFLASLLLANTPASLRLALIDSKRPVFAALERSAFLWRPIVFEEGARGLLDQLIEEMERRCTLLQRAGADELAQYNALAGGAGHSPCPRIVCVWDEFADLMLRDRATRAAIEERIGRIAGKGRAAGIHLVLATQRCGRDVLQGPIGGHLPARVALTVPRKLDSRLVLGEAGAEMLLGRGDLLYKDIGAPIRLQGLLVTPDELTALGGG